MSEMIGPTDVTRARKQARAFHRRCPPHADRDELEGVALLALVESLSRFDTSRGVRFSTYSSWRISGALLDYARDETDGRVAPGRRTHAKPRFLQADVTARATSPSAYERALDDPTAYAQGN